MGYINDNLAPGEVIVARATVHWIVFGRPVLLVMIGVALGLARPLASRSESFYAFAGALVALGLFSILAGLVVLVESLIQFRTSECAVTNKRVVFKTGFIRRKTMEILLQKVESVQINQGLLARVVGYGSVVATGSGGSKTPALPLAKPQWFREQIQGQLAVVDRS
jgi:uncharacterized membrane protein YdbT with pleckstrin-like domain